MFHLYRKCCEEEYVADTVVEHTADAPTDVVDTDVYATFKFRNTDKVLESSVRRF